MFDMFNDGGLSLPKSFIISEGGLRPLSSRLVPSSPVELGEYHCVGPLECKGEESCTDLLQKQNTKIQLNLASGKFYNYCIDMMNLVRKNWNCYK